ncbi:hypothetical protein QJQ45_023434, partial [Haematococcus lacustris]
KQASHELCNGLNLGVVCGGVILTRGGRGQQSAIKSPVPDELPEEQHLRSAAFLPWQERRERSDAAARTNSEQRKREYAPQHQERLAALQSVIQTAISEDWQHHACASGATRLEDPPLKPLQVMEVEYISMQDRFKLSVPQDGYVHCVAGDACNKPSSYAGVAKATCDLEQHTDTYLDRSGLEGAVQQLHDSGQLICLVHMQRPELQQRQQELEQTQQPETSNITACQPCAVRGVVGFVCCHGVPLLALYCNMRTAEQFVYYLLAMALLLRQCCGMLHAAWHATCCISTLTLPASSSGKGQAPTWLPSISLSADMAQLQLRGVRGPHEQRMAGAKLKCMELETAHALEKEKHHGSAEGESPLIARGLVLLVEGQVSKCVWHGKGAEYAECSGVVCCKYRTQVEQLTNDVHELGLQRDRMGQSDKDTLLKEAALYQALGSVDDAAAVSMTEEQLQAMVK